MHLSIRKLFFNNPWLLPILVFLGFVTLWIAFIFFASSHKPQEVKRVSIEQRP